MLSSRPLIISGMFRSGTTLLWRVLSADPLYENSFLEPLHPELPNEVEAVKAYKIYKKHPEILHKWSSSFYLEKFYLTKEQEYPELKEYLSELICQNNLIKSTRTTLRLNWLLDRFLSAFVINVVRDPRAVCFSYARKGNIKKQGFLKKAFWKLKSEIFGATAPSVYLPSPDLNLNIYWTSDYFKLLESVEPWSNYVKSLADKLPYIKILALWRINVEQSLKDLDDYGKGRSVTILHEDFCRAPLQTLNRVYRHLGRELPEEIKKEVKGNSVQDLGAISGHKFHLKISDKWLGQWKQVNNKIWEQGLIQAGIIPLMQRLGYYDRR